MVRKETASVTSTQAKATPTRNSNQNKQKVGSSFHRDEWVATFQDKIQKNRKTYLGVILLVLGIIQLHQFIIGIAFVTFGVLFITGFFDSLDK